MISLYNILNETTKVYRKGDAISTRTSEDIGVVELFGYPSTDTSSNVISKDAKDLYEKVDMVFINVVVDKNKAEMYKSNIENILKDYPDHLRLAQGPSYIELSPNLDLEQEGGLRLMALGKVLGLWSVISGKSLGLSDAESLNLAGMGLLNISGYNPNKK